MYWLRTHTQVILPGMGRRYKKQTNCVVPPGSSVNRPVVWGFCHQPGDRPDFRSFLLEPLLSRLCARSWDLGDLGMAVPWGVPHPRVSERIWGMDHGFTCLAGQTSLVLHLGNWVFSQDFNSEPSGDDLPCLGLWECYLFSFFPHLSPTEIILDSGKHWVKWLWVLGNDSGAA